MQCVSSQVASTVHCAAPPVELISFFRGLTAFRSGDPQERWSGGSQLHEGGKTGDERRTPVSVQTSLAGCLIETGHEKCVVRRCFGL